MKTRRAALLLSMGVGLWGASAACSAVLGIKDFAPGDGGVGSDATIVPGVDGGIPRTCADEDGGAGVLGCACSAATPTGCNGFAQQQRLICNTGTWAAGPSCGAGQNCDTRPGNGQGTCADIDPACATAAPGQHVCVGSDIIECGPDLVSKTPITTCVNQACANGACGGTCTPGTTQCTGSALETCGADGMWSTPSVCSGSCTDGGCVAFPSCQGGGPGASSDCGGSVDDAGVVTAGTHDCCASLAVPGGTFYRSYDKGVSPGGSMSYPATVSDLRLDAYEITVGRFRKFVAAVVGGWTPSDGAGKHTHLNGGSGLTAVGTDAGGFESGWSTAWNTNLTTSQAAWNTNLACDASASWTSTAAENEHRPVSCITWYEAAAFCIWDGGFLPSEAEWNYAAAGGTDQRAYPFSTTAMPNTIDCTFANFDPGTDCSATGLDDVGTLSPKGDGKWGQSDLAGNVWEWTLDSYTPIYIASCDNCTNAAALPTRVTRGGAYNLVGSALYAAYRNNAAAGARDGSVGSRCARTP